MSAPDLCLKLLADLAASGIELHYEGDRLRFRAPKGALTDELRGRISGQRASLIANLRAKAMLAIEEQPLLHTQSGIWLQQQQAPASPAFCLGVALSTTGRLDLNAVRHATQALVDRHAALRTTFAVREAQLVRRVGGAAAANVSLQEVDGADRAGLRDRVELELARPIDLATGPTFRSCVFSNAAEQVVLLKMHHIVADFWTLRLLRDEFLKLYAEACTGRPSGLGRPEQGYDAFVRERLAFLEGSHAHSLWEYWRAELADMPPPLTFAGRPVRATAPSFAGNHVEFAVPSALSQQVQSLAARNGCTSFVVLLGAFQLLLARLSSERDIVTGVPVLGRSSEASLAMVGCFANALPIRSRLDPAATLPAFLGALRETVVGGLDAQDYPVSLMVQRLQPSRERAAQPLFNTFFNMLEIDSGGVGGNPEPGPELTVEPGELGLALYPLVCQAGLFDLTLDVVETAAGLRGVLKYAADLFDKETAVTIAGQYIGLLEVMAGAPDGMVSAVVQDPAEAAAERLLADLAARGVQISLEGDRLRVNAQKGVLDEAAKSAIASLRAAIISRLSLAPAGTAVASIRRVPRGGAMPISSAQRRFWLLNRIQPGASGYDLTFAAALTGRLDRAVLAGAVDLIVERHETLRTAIGERDGQPWLQILPRDSLRLACTTAIDMAAAIEAAIAMGQRPFDMARGPLARFALISVSQTAHLLICSVHHSVTDGWSNALLSRELFQAYEALSAGVTPDLAPLPIGYLDYAAWEAEQLHSARTALVASFWRAELEGAPPLLNLPSDRPRGALPAATGGRISRMVSGTFIERLTSVARSHRATLFMLMLAAWEVILHRYSGQECLVVGTPVANRELPVLEGVVGCFVNAIPLRSQLVGNPAFSAFLEQTKRTALAAFDHRDIPFDRLVEAVNPGRGAGYAPIYQVQFNLLSFQLEVPTASTLQIEPVELPVGSAKLDLSLDILPVKLGEHAGSHQFIYDFARELFDHSTIERLHDGYVTLLQSAVDNPACPVLDLDMLSAGERRRLAQFSGAAVRPTAEGCMHHLFEASARHHADRIAISGHGGTLRYDQLDARANQLAHHLVQLGIQPGALVAVCMERSVEIPVVLAAIWKVGAAYVPLDPSHPKARLRHIIVDAGASCVITQSGLETIVKDAVARIVLLDAHAAAIGASEDTPLEIEVRPDDLAYVIYTSGSTGRPKGVEVEHRNFVAFLEAMRERPGLHREDVLLAVTTLAFDIAGLEIWLPLTVGGRIVLASAAEAADPTRLAEMLVKHDVSVLQATPATWRLLLGSGWPGRPTMRALCGGEAMPAEVAAQLVGRVDALWNMYGPTETTIWSTVDEVSETAAPIPIGRPIANTTVHVVDASDRPVPIGVAGELLIGGAGVARGYRNRPDLTAKAFTRLQTETGPRRVYRTGDVARFRSDGKLECLGRLDHQVKLRGYRIELGEIEAVLAAQSGVAASVVVPQRTSPGDERLVGYVTLAPGATFQADQTRIALRATLPDYMVPSQIVVLPSLPLTPNGKVDRAALPAPEGLASTPIPSSAMTPDQLRVARVWTDVLRLGRVGLHQNFFDLGGHSLLLITLQTRLTQEFGKEIALVELFQRTTVAQQAEWMSGASAMGANALERVRARVERQLNV